VSKIVTFRFTDATFAFSDCQIKTAQLSHAILYSNPCEGLGYAEVFILFFLHNTRIRRGESDEWVMPRSIPLSLRIHSNMNPHQFLFLVVELFIQE